MFTRKSLIIALLVAFAGTAFTIGSVIAADATNGLATAGFVRKASADGTAEVELAQIALRNTQAPDVRAFAQRMIDDHSAANQKLAALAAQRNLSTPPPNAQAENLINRLQGLHGKAFDKAYASAMLKDHKKAVKLFEKASRGVGDKPVRNFAAHTLPTLKQHLAMAKKLEKAHG